MADLATAVAADPQVWAVSSAAVHLDQQAVMLVPVLVVMPVQALKAASAVFLEATEGSVESSVATVVPVLEDLAMRA